MTMKNNAIPELILVRVTEILEILIETKELQTGRIPARTLVPQHVDNYWIMDYLGIKRTTFYTQVRNKLLFPVFKIGKREYFDREDVYALMRHRDGGDQSHPKAA
ncbi:Helix-turn-helix domain-containing protein [bacterium A37T11]|nr:Helix-turn-helix domain-containing protein [bacterium A37T11]